jgi:hypothetical protein
MMGMACRFAHDEMELRAIRAAEMERRGMPFNSVQNSMILEDEVDTMQQDDYWGMPSQDDLEVVLMQDRDFSRQTSMETVQSTFSRQVSQEMGNNPFGRQQTPLLTAAYLQPPAFHPPRPAVEMRTSHSPAGSSQESTQDSDSQRVISISLMEHLAEPVKSQESGKYDYNYDDAVNTDDEIEDVNDITKCLFDEGSCKDNIDHGLGNEVRKFGTPCDNDEKGNYNMFGYVSPKTANGAMAFEGRPVLNCAIQNTFLHFSPGLDAQPLRRSNSLGALPLRGL